MNKIGLLSIGIIIGFSYVLISGTTTQITVSVNQTPCSTGINENTIQKSYNIYPNPSTGIIKIEALTKISTKSISLTITNVLGEIVWQTLATEAKNTTITEADLSQQPNGIYFFVVREGQNIVFEEKVIKK